MIITIFFALASISLIIFVPIYLKKKNNLYKYKPQEKMSLKKQKKTIKNIWELGDFANSIFWVSNKYVMIIELGSIEYKLMNDEEQDNIDNNLMKISKTFKNQVQFFSTIEKIDTSYKVEEIRNNINKQKNSNIKEYGESIIEYLENIMQEENLYVRKNYLIIESQSSIKKLKANADGMQGQTGKAIQEKCIVLSSQIDSLKTNLNYTIRLIQAAVKEYQEKDRELAAAIKSGGI